MADRFVVLHRGQVDEIGTHEKLANANVSTQLSFAMATVWCRQRIFLSSHQRQPDKKDNQSQSDCKHDDDFPPRSHLVPMNACMVADVNVMMAAMAHGRNLDTPYARKRESANGRYFARDK